MNTVIALLIFGLVLYLVFWIIDLIFAQIPAPAPIAVVVKAIVAIIALVRLLDYIGFALPSRLP